MCLKVTQACSVEITSMIKDFTQTDPMEFLEFLIKKTHYETNDSYIAKKLMIKYSDKSNCEKCKRAKTKEG